MTTSPPQIAGFEALAEIGRGGYGVVYRAWETALQRQVAIKMMWANLDGAARDRFTREGLAMSALSGHPNVLAIHQVGVTDEGHPYLVMPYLARGSLAQQLKADDDRGMPWPDATRLAIRLAGALATAHAAGILHRDIKPDNVLLSDYGEPELADFGIARMTGGFETTAGGVTASVLHAPPEILNGHPATVTSDVYSLGSLLFTLLNGVPAFLPREGEEMVALYVRVARDPIPDLRPAGVPDGICRAVEQAMAKEPDERQQSAAELGHQLQTAQHEAGMSWTEMAVTAESGSPVKVVDAHPTSAETVASPAPASQPVPSSPSPTPPGTSSPPASGEARSRRPILAIAGVAIVLALVVLGAVVFLRSPRDDAKSPPTTTAVGDGFTLSSTQVSIPFHLDTGQTRRLTFNAKTGQRLTGIVRFAPAPTAPIHVEVKFNDASVIDQTTDGGTMYLEPTVLQNSGPYAVIVGPSPSPTDVTVELVQAVDPAEQTTTINAPPVHVVLVQARQLGIVNFEGKAGDRVQGQWTWTGQRGIYTTAQLLGPDGSVLDQWSVLDDPGLGQPITLPADGTYRLQVSVDGDATGSGDASIKRA